MQPFGYSRYGPKIGGAVPLWGRGAGSPSSTAQCVRAEAYLHAKFNLDPSKHLATVQERYRQDGHCRTDRQTDNGPIAYANRRTVLVLQTVAQKLLGRFNCFPVNRIQVSDYSVA